MCLPFSFLVNGIKLISFKPSLKYSVMLILTTFLLAMCDVFSNTKGLIGVGLDAPLISRVAEGLRSRGINIQGELYTVDGVKKAIKDYLVGGSDHDI